MSNLNNKRRRLTAISAVHKKSLQSKNTASQQVQFHQQKLESEKLKLDQLTEFQQDYFANMRGDMQSGAMKPQSAAMAHQFLGQLQDIIARQIADVDNYETQLEKSKQRWIRANHEEQTIEGMVDVANLEIQQDLADQEDTIAEQSASQLAIFAELKGREHTK